MQPIIDIHIHVQPLEMLRPEALAVFRRGRKDWEDVERYSADAKAFLAFLDRLGIERAGLINYVSPDIMGFTPEVNDWIAKYCSADPNRLLAFGSVHPYTVPDSDAEVNRIAKLGIRALKLHPCQQVISPNAYRDGFGPLASVCERAQANHLPVMIHTGTSIFPGARNVHAQPILCDDVRIDFPNLVVILAHGGRPLWMNEAFFLVRRHKNMYWIFPVFRRRNFWNTFSASRKLPTKSWGEPTGQVPVSQKSKETWRNFRRCRFAKTRNEKSSTTTRRVCSRVED